ADGPFNPSPVKECPVVANEAKLIDELVNAGPSLGVQSKIELRGVVAKCVRQGADDEHPIGREIHGRSFRGRASVKAGVARQYAADVPGAMVQEQHRLATMAIQKQSMNGSSLGVVDDRPETGSANPLAKKAANE